MYIPELCAQNCIAMRILGFREGRPVLAGWGKEVVIFHLGFEAHVGFGQAEITRKVKQTSQREAETSDIQRNMFVERQIACFG